jgi:hypothetical protein
MGAERGLRTAPLLVGLLLLGCASTPPVVNPLLVTAAGEGDALAVADALEALIEHASDTPADRQFAYETMRAVPEGDTAAYAFARASVTGRLVQQQGLRGAQQVQEVEAWALRSRELDPGFRDGAATRLLGTLYVIVPAAFLENGDSEHGVALLEQLVAERPDVVENHLRLAEAYIALGDSEPAAPELCLSLARRAELRHDDQQLLDQLLVTAGPPRCVGVD